MPGMAGPGSRKGGGLPPRPALPWPCWRAVGLGARARAPTQPCRSAPPPGRGSTVYASLAAHSGKDVGWKDDLWSWVYVLAELIDGSLPWRVDRQQQQEAVEGAELEQQQQEAREAKEELVRRPLGCRCCHRRRRCFRSRPGAMLAWAAAQPPHWELAPAPGRIPSRIRCALPCCRRCARSSTAPPTGPTSQPARSCQVGALPSSRCVSKPPARLPAPRAAAPTPTPCTLHPAPPSRATAGHLQPPQHAQLRRPAGLQLHPQLPGKAARASRACTLRQPGARGAAAAAAAGR